MNKITVVALGPGNRAYLTLGALETMKAAKKCVLRTEKCDAAQYLKEQGLSFDSLDFLYDQAEDFDALNEAIENYLLKAAQSDDVCYAVFDPYQDASVSGLLQKKACTLMPGVSLSAPYLAACPASRAEVQSASGLYVSDSQHDLLITELSSPYLAADCALSLLEWYGENTQVFFFPPDESPQRKPVVIPLRELSRQKKYDHTSAVFIPAVPLIQKKRFDVWDLVRIMEILRGEGGCDWDKAQTHHTLRPFLVEEAYETSAAIEEEDWAHMAEELGDVLLQVVFQADIGKRSGTVTLGDITTSICAKMLERHPHIFAPDKKAKDWEEIKMQKRGFTTVGESMREMPRSFPALMRAEKAQAKAAKVGFDWTEPLDALYKVEEETQEVRQAAREGNAAHLAEELGDLLFACVNTARLFGVESETCVQQATDKFIHRFCKMEEAILRDGRELHTLTLSQMDKYWEQVKREDHQ